MPLASRSSCSFLPNMSNTCTRTIDKQQQARVRPGADCARARQSAFDLPLTLDHSVRSWRLRCRAPDRPHPSKSPVQTSAQQKRIENGESKIHFQFVEAQTRNETRSEFART